MNIIPEKKDFLQEFCIDQLILTSRISYNRLKQAKSVLMLHCSNKRDKSPLQILPNRSKNPYWKHSGTIFAYNPNATFFKELRRIFPNGEFYIQRIELCKRTYGDPELLKQRLLENSKTEVMKYSRNRTNYKDTEYENSRSKKAVRYVDAREHKKAETGKCEGRKSNQETNMGFMTEEYRIFGNKNALMKAGITSLDDLAAANVQDLYEYFKSKHTKQLAQVDFSKIGRFISGKTGNPEAMGKDFVLCHGIDLNDLSGIRYLLKRTIDEVKQPVSIRATRIDGKLRFLHLVGTLKNVKYQFRFCKTFINVKGVKYEPIEGCKPFYRKANPDEIRKAKAQLSNIIR